MSDDILDKFQKANALAQSGGGSRGPQTLNVYANVVKGENRVRLGGVFVIMNQHFVNEVIQPQFVRQKGGMQQDNKNKFPISVTCLNWDIDNEKEVADEFRCCPLCDLRMAARKLERDVKNSDNPNKEKLAKDLNNVSGKAMPRTKYMWPAIMRADPYVLIKGDDGQEKKAVGWKVLKLSPEANKGIETLYKQYPKLLTAEEGCDVTVMKNVDKRTSYTVTFALSGAGIAVTPLTAEELAMPTLELKRFVMNHVSPRSLFTALPEHYQELITKVTGKKAEDYPEESPIKRERADSGSAVKTEDVDIAGDYEGEATPPPPPPMRAPAKAAVVAAPKTPPAPPKMPAAPKAPAKPPAPPKPVAPPPPPPKTEDPMPACFGTCDRSDAQCAECQVIDACEAKKG